MDLCYNAHVCNCCALTKKDTHKSRNGRKKIWNILVHFNPCAISIHSLRCTRIGHPLIFFVSIVRWFVVGALVNNGHNEFIIIVCKFVQIDLCDHSIWIDFSCCSVRANLFVHLCVETCASTHPTPRIRSHNLYHVAKHVKWFNEFMRSNCWSAYIANYWNLTALLLLTNDYNRFAIKFIVLILFCRNAHVCANVIAGK